MKLKMRESFYIVSFWRRLIAYIVDLIVINLVVVLQFNLLFKEKIAINDLGFLINSNPERLFSLVFTGIIIAILSVVYWALFEYFLSQSLGKMLFGIKVISLRGSLKFSQCLLRNITKFSSLLLLFDCIHMINGKGMRYFDKLSKTKVVGT